MVDKPAARSERESDFPDLVARWERVVRAGCFSLLGFRDRGPVVSSRLVRAKGLGSSQFQTRRILDELRPSACCNSSRGSIMVMVAPPKEPRSRARPRVPKLPQVYGAQVGTMAVEEKVFWPLAMGGCFSWSRRWAAAPVAESDSRRQGLQRR